MSKPHPELGLTRNGRWRGRGDHVQISAFIDAQHKNPSHDYRFHVLQRGPNCSQQSVGGPSTSQMIPLLHVEGQRRRVGTGIDAEHHSGSGVVENGMRPTRAV